MGVAMAIIAGVELGFFSLLGVAPGAGHRGVFTFKRIPRLGMIKRGPLDQEPTRGCMALPAVGAQCPGMGIQVAIGT